MVLSDIYSEGLTGKSNLLKVNQHKTHSVLSQRSAEKLFLETLERKDRIIWPPSSTLNEWTNLDHLVMNELLQLPSNLSVQDKVDCLESSIYNKASDLLGFVPLPKKRLGGKNRCVNISINLVIKKNLLLKELERVADPEKKVELLGLLESVRSRLRSLRKGEHKQKARWKKKQANNLVNKNPYLASKRVLDPRCYIKLSAGKNSMDQHKSSAVFDPFSNVPLPPLDGLPPAPPICKSFTSENLSFSEFKKVLNSRRNGSAPEINMIPYKVYKLCPNICDYLFGLFKSCLQNCVVPVQWRIATEVYIPKSRSPDPNNIKDFRPISLLNVEGKLFFSILSKRLEKHIYNNKLINSSIQKGCMEKVPGCWEHMSVIWDELKSRKTERSNIAAIWLDIANACGSAPHQLLFFALRRYGIPEHWVSLFIKYMRACGVSAGQIQLLLVGIIT